MEQNLKSFDPASAEGGEPLEQAQREAQRCSQVQGLLFGDRTGAGGQLKNPG